MVVVDEVVDEVMVTVLVVVLVLLEMLRVKGAVVLKVPFGFEVSLPAG